MNLLSFENIFQSLAQLEALQTSISRELKCLQLEHEALLGDIGKHSRGSHDELKLGPTQFEIVDTSSKGIVPILPTGRTGQLAGRKNLVSNEWSALDTISAGSAGHFKAQRVPHPTDLEPETPEFGNYALDVPDHGRTPDALAVSILEAETPDFGKYESRRPDCRKFEIWPIWTTDVYEIEQHPSLPAHRTSRNEVKCGDEMRGESCLQFAITRPSSRRRVVWDIISVLMLGYDLLVLPLEAFKLHETPFTRSMTLTTTIFWSLDMYASFTTGYHTASLLEMRPAKIAKRYLRTWFFIDISVLTVDYCIMFAEGASSVDFLGFARIGKALRILRILRMFRLLRLIKVVAIFQELNDSIFSETFSIAFGVFKLIFFIAIVNHFLACGWYAISVQNSEAGINRWVKALAAVDSDEESFAWLYTSSLHWSITQFTPASMEIVPRNAFERSYALCVILFAMVLFSSFISSITNSMSHLRSINFEQTRQQELLRRFITQNRVSLNLGNRILVFLRQSRYTENQNRRVHEKHIPALSTLPVTLQLELRSEVFAPMLETHPFFRLYAQFDEVGMLNICNCCVAETFVSRAQVVFTNGEACIGMYFVLGGKLGYWLTLNTVPTEVVSGESLCEMGLWIQWEHSGQLAADMNSELIVLDSQLFRATVRKTDSFEACKKYAQQYAVRMRTCFNLAERPSTDIWSCPFSFKEIAPFFEGGSRPQEPRNSRFMLGAPSTLKSMMPHRSASVMSLFSARSTATFQSTWTKASLFTFLRSMTSRGEGGEEDEEEDEDEERRHG